MTMQRIVLTPRLGPVPLRQLLLRLLLLLLPFGAAVASPWETARVRVEVQDGSGAPLPARMSVHDAFGDHFPGEPDSVLLSHCALGSYFYTDGSFTMDLPCGSTDIVVGRGFEWLPQRLIADLCGDTTLTFVLERFIDLRSQGWYSGDDHVHTRHYPFDYDIGPEEIHWIGRAEDLAQVWCLDQDYEFTGGPHEISTTETAIYYTTEYRNMALGHVGLLGLDQYVGFFCCWPPDPVCPMLCEIRERWNPPAEGAMVLVHPQTGAGFFEDQQWPGIGLGRELPVLAVLGALDALEILVYTNVPDIYVDDWYALLNCGLRIPPSAGADACVANYVKKPPGGYRVYVQETPGEDHDHAAWVRGLRGGRSFVSNYPLVPSFSVDGVPAGGILSLPGPVVDVAVHFRIESALDLRSVRVVRNGAIAAFITIPPAAPDPVVVDTTLQLHLTESAWIAVRVDGETDLRHAVNSDLFAHTAPVYVHLDGAPVRRTGPAAHFLDWIDTLEVFVELRGNWPDEEEHAAVLERLNAARDFYRSLFWAPPGEFALLTPGNGDSLDISDPVRFSWVPAGDPEYGDRVTYTLEISSDSLFSDAWAVCETTATEVDVTLYLPPNECFWWHVIACDRGGNTTLSSPPDRWFFVESAPAGVGERGDAEEAGGESGRGVPDPEPLAIARLTAWPNPSRGPVWLRFGCDTDASSRWPDEATLEVYDATGRLVTALGAGVPGGLPLSWEGCDARGAPVPSGIYWLWLRSPRDSRSTCAMGGYRGLVPVLIVR